EFMELDKVVDPQKEAVLAEFERRKRARQMAIPTDELEVKLMLRQLGHPICLFGEDKPDRRERLRSLLSQLDDDQVHQILHKDEPRRQMQKLDEETWYHEGPASLRDAKVFIARYSLPKA